MRTCPECGQAMPSRDGISFDPESNVIIWNGKHLKMEPMMAKLFMGLYDRRPRFVPSDYLFDDLYGLENDEEWPARRVIHVYLSKLRRALKGTPFIIENAPHKGWRLITKDKQTIKWK